MSNFCQKFNFPKTALNCGETLLLMKGINNLAKKIFLAQFKIVPNFTIFVRSAPVEFPSKIQFSKNCLKLWRNTSFDYRNK